MTAPGTPSPRITVIMATWGRGRHILPSVRSVLGQDFGNFELIIVGDACTDETEAVVRALDDARVRWINLSARVGSQSGPNNAGLAAARGAVIAYLGHDDIWERSHLTKILRMFDARVDAGVVVSGLNSYPPEGVETHFVNGIFEDDAVKHRAFFQPSCFAHRRDICDRIGVWRGPMACRAPVDEDFLGRAADADLRFVSTGDITVHKFNSAFRYLSYLRHESHEQEAMLARLDRPDHAKTVAAIVAQARRTGRLLSAPRGSYDHLPPGALWRQSTIKRGLLQRPVFPVGQGASLAQRPEPCASDWRTHPIFGIRLHGWTLRPRMLLPLTADKEVTLRFRVVHPSRSAFGPLDLRVNDRPVLDRLRRLRLSFWGWTAVYEAKVALLPDRSSLLEFHLSEAQLSKRDIAGTGIGFGIGKFRVRPEDG